MSDLKQLGKYEISGALGKGAMGVVYKGFDPHIERFVAIKTVRMDTIDPELAGQYKARFRNEAKAAGRLHHPNIVGVYEFGEDGPLTFIAMEYVDGTGLREHLNRRASFDFAQLALLMEQLLNALDYAHARGVVHRDIKPSNLIITQQGVLKVADFGVARVDASTLTMAGAAIGTPSYMSPEQFRGLEIDARSDLFSVGVVLYELLTGSRPFRGNLESVGYKICHEEPEPPSQLSSLNLPKAVDELIAKALAKDPASRFQDARAFRQALHEVAQMSVEIDSGEGTTLVNIGTLMLQKPAPVWDDDTLRSVERELARAVGPMAKVILRRAAMRTTDRIELCTMLSDDIADVESRRTFVEACLRLATGATDAAAARSGRGTAPPPSTLARSRNATAPGASAAPSAPGTLHALGSATQAMALDPAFIDQMTARLAVYIGPIASVLAKKAAREAKSRSEFLLHLADNLGTQERSAFLREVGLPDKPLR